jgi:drug/metabolite transporter (DMT)-like permease
MIFFRERQKAGFWIGLILALGGVTLLVINDIFESNSLVVKGIFLGLFAGMFYAGYQLFTQAGRKTINTLTYLFISTLTAALALGIVIPLFNYTFTGYSSETWILWLIMGVGIQAGAWFLINFAQGYIPASVVAPTLLIQPVITAMLAITLLKEDLTIWHIGGGIIVVLGIYVVHFSKQKLI